MKGAKVDAFFHPKTETQLMDQQVFFKETLPRLERHLQKVLKEKKGIKWNLMYHGTLTMPDKYRAEPLKYEGYFRTPDPLISTYPQQLRQQLNMAMGTVEERMATFMQAGSVWILSRNHAVVLEMVDYQFSQQKLTAGFGCFFLRCCLRFSFLVKVLGQNGQLTWCSVVPQRLT